MRRKTGLALLLLATALTQTSFGIEWLHRRPWPCGDTYYGMQCSCLYWHEWFSHKPCCCDPCNQCGQYTASRNPYVVTGPRYTRFGEVYSDGSGSNAPGAIGEMYNAPSQGPTPAQPRGGVLDDLGPTPAEELPGPTTSMPRSGGVRTASQPRVFDSLFPSRTLGNSQRTRLFAR